MTPEPRAARLNEIGARFSLRLYPRKTLRVEIWQRGEPAQFCTRAEERDVVLLSHGSARFAG